MNVSRTRRTRLVTERDQDEPSYALRRCRNGHQRRERLRNRTWRALQSKWQKARDRKGWTP